jgi:pentatricopeptide repeat protein
MEKYHVEKTHTTFHILLRFWARRSEVHMVERLLVKMRQEGHKLTRTALYHAIYCYTLNLDTEKAEVVLRDYLNIEPTDSAEKKLTGGCAQCLLFAYRDLIDAASDYCNYRKERALENADTIYQRFQNHTDHNKKARGMSLHRSKHSPPLVSDCLTCLLIRCLIFA